MKLGSKRVGQWPVILHEQADQSQTIIEKLERHGSAAGFAVVPLVARAEGKAQDADALSPPKRRLRAWLLHRQAGAETGRRPLRGGLGATLRPIRCAEEEALRELGERPSCRTEGRRTLTNRCSSFAGGKTSQPTRAGSDSGAVLLADANSVRRKAVRSTRPHGDTRRKARTSSAA